MTSSLGATSFRPTFWKKKASTLSWYCSFVIVFPCQIAYDGNNIREKGKYYGTKSTL